MSWWEFMLAMIVIIPITVLWIGCIVDIISRPDLRGVSKALWVFGVLILPVIGSLVYIVLRPREVVDTRIGALDDVWTGEPKSSPRAGL
jgi:hypothetical protein